MLIAYGYVYQDIKNNYMTSKINIKQDIQIQPHVQRYEALFFSEVSTMTLNKMTVYTQK